MAEKKDYFILDKSKYADIIINTFSRGELILKGRGKSTSGE